MVAGCHRLFLPTCFRPDSAWFSLVLLLSRSFLHPFVQGSATCVRRAGQNISVSIPPSRHSGVVTEFDESIPVDLLDFDSVEADRTQEPEEIKGFDVVSVGTNESDSVTAVFLEAEIHQGAKRSITEY